MAFVLKQMNACGGQSRSRKIVAGGAGDTVEVTPAVWSYFHADDNLTTIRADGYFNGARQLLSPGDCLIVSPNGASIDLLTVDTVPPSSGGADVTTGTLISSDGEINVKSFGAKGDGVTDDTAAIKAALATLTGGDGSRGGTVFFPEGEYIVSETLVINNEARIRGAGRTNTKITATSGTFTGTALVQLGDTAINVAFATRVEDMQLNCNDKALIGVFSNTINEMSGLYRVNVKDSNTIGIQIKTDVTPTAQNWFMEHIQVTMSSSVTGASIGIDIDNGNKGKFYLSDVTCAVTGNGITASTGLSLSQIEGALSNIHVESVATGLDITNSAAFSVLGVTGADNVTDLIAIDANTKEFMLSGLKKKGGTNTINHTGESTVSASSVGFYTYGDGTSGATRPLISTVPDFENRMHAIDLRKAPGNVLKINGTQVLTSQRAAISDASGGATIDAEARAALNALLAHARTHGLIAT